MKDYRKHAIATLFGQVAVQLPRFRCTACDAIEVGIEWPSHCRSTPELDRLQAHLSALMTYRTAADILEQMFPAGVGKDKETMRRHTLFTKRMGRFLTALLKRPIRFVFPRIWFTKGETLKAYTALPGSDDWRETRSCWQNARHCSLDGNLVQCGVCAACMLRRMSIHSAGLADDDSAYACSDLHAATFEDSMQLGFHMRGRALREYAIAGAQHLDHMADLVLPLHRPALRRHAVLVAQALDKPVADVETELVNVIERHAAEWNDFLQDKGARSFLRQWTRA